MTLFAIFSVIKNILERSQKNMESSFINKRGRGRPRMESSKKSRCNVRIDDDCESMIRELTYFKGKSRSEIVRDAIKFYYNYESRNF